MLFRYLYYTDDTCIWTNETLAKGGDIFGSVVINNKMATHIFRKEAEKYFKLKNTFLFTNLLKCMIKVVKTGWLHPVFVIFS